MNLFDMLKPSLKLIFYIMLFFGIGEFVHDLAKKDEGAWFMVCYMLVLCTVYICSFIYDGIREKAEKSAKNNDAVASKDIRRKKPKRINWGVLRMPLKCLTGILVWSSWHHFMFFIVVIPFNFIYVYIVNKIYDARDVNNSAAVGVTILMVPALLCYPLSIIYRCSRLRKLVHLRLARKRRDAIQRKLKKKYSNVLENKYIISVKHVNM